MIQSKRFVVTGRVQGVGYRYFVMQTVRGLAQRGIEITGWVRNMPDRSVEVCADGSGNDLQALSAEIAKGPSMGRVDQVRNEPAAPTGESTFLIKY